MKKVLLWLGGIVLVLLLIVAGFAYYWLKPIPSSAAALNKTLIPSPQPGPDDAYPHYAAMFKEFKISPADTTNQLTDSEGNLKPENIPAAKQELNAYQKPLQEMELGAQKKICTFPFPQLPEGEIPQSLANRYSHETYLISSSLDLSFIFMPNKMLLREQVAYLENRPADAIRDCMLTLQYGRHLNQGPLIYRMLGLNAQTRSFTKILQLLSPHAAVSYAGSIQKSLEQFSSPAVLDTKDLARYETLGRRDDVTGISRAVKKISGKMDTGNMEYFKYTQNILCNGINSKYGLCRLGAAVRIYQSTHHQEFPASLKDLTPGTLAQLPVDPFTQKDYLYTVSADKNIAILSSPSPNLSKGNQDQQNQINRLKKELVLTLQK